MPNEPGEIAKRYWRESNKQDSPQHLLACFVAAIDEATAELRDELDNLRIGPLPPTEREELLAKIQFLEEALDATPSAEPMPGLPLTSQEIGSWHDGLGPPLHAETCAIRETMDIEPCNCGAIPAKQDG